MSRVSYVNGRYMPYGSATVSIEDRGFQFADGVYGAIALINGCFIDVEAHFDRLEHSLGDLKISLSKSRRSLHLVMHELARRNRLKNGFLYIQVTRGVAHRDFKFPKNVKSTLVIILCSGSFGKIAVKKVITVPDIRWKRRDIKTTALIAQVLAKQTAVEKGADDALLFDNSGFITEGASSNAWIIDKDDNLLTRPAKDAMILKGVTRNTLLRLCREKNIRVIERPFSVKEAYQAKEVFITGSTSLVVPVVEIDGHKIGNGKPGVLTSELFKMYMVYANDPKRKQERWNEK
ncbi:MAG: D-amino-acid transaminase [Alphaproteobacteria bacterium]|nr:D-amino-acid transaminase [Alphaproteobacteria bacterium]